MKRTALPTIAGVINISIGAINLLGVLGVGIAIAIISSQIFRDTTALIVLWIVFVVLLVFCIPSIVGGIYALQRKDWGLALIGSIASFITWNFIGLIPVILIALSKDEFGVASVETPPPVSLEVAKERYAKGDISKDEYEQIKRDIS